MYCNKNLHCHDTRQKDNTVVHSGLFKNETVQTGMKQRNLKLSSSLNGSRTFFKKKCAKSNALA